VSSAGANGQGAHPDHREELRRAVAESERRNYEALRALRLPVEREPPVVFRAAP
jgi:hypothetical protein